MLKNTKNTYFVILVFIFISGIVLNRIFFFPFKQKPLKENVKPPQINLETEKISKEPETEEASSSSLISVTKVIDGDTIEIEGGERVRYIGMDAPEKSSGGECFSSESTERNKNLVLGKKVLLEKDVSETDKYKRLLRYVWIDNLMVNEILVKEGFARVSTYPPDVKYKDKFLASEQFARENKKGLWGLCGSVEGATTVQQSSTSDQTNANTISAVSEETSTETKKPETDSKKTVSVSPFCHTSESPTCRIKGNVSSSKIYHLPGCGSYEKTVIKPDEGECWFCTEAEASTAGWRKAKNCP